MQTVTVAIADTNTKRSARLEQVLKGGQGIEVMSNVMTNSNGLGRTARLCSTLEPDDIEDFVIEVIRLRPRILFFNLDSPSTISLSVIGALNRECPDTFILVLTNGSVDEEDILEVLANGARGYLSHETDPGYFRKAVRVVDQGEIWVPRKMLGRIMDRVLQ